MARKVIIVILALVATLAIPSAASAAYQRVVPSGLNGSSPSAALKDVKAIAEHNDQYARVLAAQTGAGVYRASDYKAVRFGKATASTSNSALDGSGKLVKVSGGVGTKTVIIQNVRTGGYVAVMIRCGNPRLKGHVQRVVKIRAIKRIYINKSFSRTVTHVCPSGQSVTITASGKVKGWLRVSARGWASAARIYVSGQVSLAISQKVTVECGGGTPPPPSGGADCSNTVTGNGNTVGGNCNTGVCSNINSPNSTVNCGDTPTCPEGTIGTYPNCAWPGPSAQIDAGPAHFFVNGTGYIYARARAGTGRNVTSVTISVTAGHTSGLVSSTTYDQQPCPAGWSCYRIQYWAPSYAITNPNFVTATVTATQDDDQMILNSTQFEIKPDGFGG